MELESDSDTNCYGSLEPQSLKRGLEELEIRDRVETIQTTALLRSARILGRFLET